MAKDATTIAGELRTEAARLSRLAAAYARAAVILEGADEPMPLEEAAQAVAEETIEHYAPFGYKADGTPRKRPVPSAETMAKVHASRARNAREKGARKPQEQRLKVISSTHPTERELEGREVVHTTEAPKENTA